MRSPEFDQRVLDYLPYLKKLSTKLERDPRKREDLVQETVATILAKHESFRPDGGFVLWITFQMRAIVSNARRKKNLSVEDVDGKHAARVAVAPTQEDYVFAREIVAGLPASIQAAAVMRGTGMLYREIGAVEGVSGQAVHARMSASLRALRASNG